MGQFGALPEEPSTESLQSGMMLDASDPTSMECQNKQLDKIVHAVFHSEWEGLGMSSAVETGLLDIART